MAIGPSVGPADAATGFGVCKAIAADGDPSSVTVRRYPVAASPWARPGRATPGPLVLIRRGSTRVGVLCDSSGKSWRTPIVLRRGEHLGPISLADPWIAWAVQRRGARSAVRTARLGRSTATASVRVRSTVREVATTVDGNTAIAATTGATRRFTLLRRSGDATNLRPARLAAGATVLRLGVGRWGTHGLALRDDRAGGRAYPIDPRRSDLQARCRPSASTVWSGTTRVLRVYLSDSRSWARTADPTEKHLAVCGPDGRLLRADYLDLPGDGFLETDGPEVYSRSRVAIAAAGPLVLIRREQVAGTTGTGTDARTVRSGLVVRGDGTVDVLRPRIMVGTPSAAAFVTDGQLWLSDADGLHTVPTTHPLTVVNTALNLQATSLLIRTPGASQRIPFRALPPHDTATLATDRGDVRLDADDLCGASYSAGSYFCDAAPGSPPQLEDPSSPPAPTE